VRFLWDHELISYGQRVAVANPDGSTRMAYPVTYRGGEVAGWVARAESHFDGWAYLPAGREGYPWTAGFEARADAADNLLSWCAPSASWLS
jgi:hypothetical protein